MSEILGEEKIDRTEAILLFDMLNLRSWSGCGGNDNRFYSLEHCMKNCGQFAVNQVFPEQFDVKRSTAYGSFQDKTRAKNVCFSVIAFQTKKQTYGDNFDGTFA